MMPVRRDLRFNLPPERACDWHAQGSHVTHFFNALSLLFPAGERFFHGQRAPLSRRHRRPRC